MYIYTKKEWDYSFCISGQKQLFIIQLYKHVDLVIHLITIYIEITRDDIS